MASIKDWAKARLEVVIDKRRVAGVADELELLLVSIFTLVFDYKLIVKLLGGRRPSDKGKSGHAAGEWGHTDQAHYKVDVPLAMAGLGAILGEVWTALGATLTEDADFGMSRRARDVVSQLSDVNTAGFYADYFDRLAMAGELWRTRPSAPVPDIEALGDEAEAAELAPVVAKQDTEAIAESTATRIAEAHFRSLQAPIAGAKRNAAGNQTGTQPVLATAVAPAAAVARLPGTPGPVGAPGTRAAKRATRTAAHQAAQAAAGTPAAARAPAPAPASVPAPASTQAVVAPTPVQAAAAPAASAWVPTFLPLSITRLIDKSTKAAAIDAFDFVCRQQGLAAHMPCAIKELTGSCQGPPQCRKCTAQAALVSGGGTATAAPPGLVARVKAACNADTASRII
jgi:hypothetical protein